MGEFLQIGTSLLSQAAHGAAAGADSSAGHGGGGTHGETAVGLFFYILVVLAVIFFAMAAAKKGLNERVFKNKWTSRFEQLFLFIENMCVGTIGPHGRKYIPMIMSFWMIIFVGNVVALFIGNSPTASLSFNLGMALVSIAYVQYEGMKANGVFGHLSHFAGPKLGIALVPISIMIFIIEIISELMKNVSLSLRLYGNIHGGHQAVVAMNDLGTGYYIPWGEFLLPIKLLTCVVQAMIFTLLTCVYLSLVTAHHEHEEHGPDEHNPDHAVAMPASAH